MELPVMLAVLVVGKGAVQVMEELPGDTVEVVPPMVLEASMAQDMEVEKVQVPGTVAVLRVIPEVVEAVVVVEEDPLPEVLLTVVAMEAGLAVGMVREELVEVVEAVVGAVEERMQVDMEVVEDLVLVPGVVLEAMGEVVVAAPVVVVELTLSVGVLMAVAQGAVKAVVMAAATRLRVVMINPLLPKEETKYTFVPSINACKSKIRLNYAERKGVKYQQYALHEPIKLCSISHQVVN